MIEQLGDLQRQMALHTTERHAANKAIIGTQNEIVRRIKEHEGVVSATLQRFTETVERLETAISGDSKMGHRGLVARVEAVERIADETRLEVKAARRIGAFVLALFAVLGATILWFKDVLEWLRPK